MYKAICKKNFNATFKSGKRIVIFKVGFEYDVCVGKNGITVFEDRNHYYTFYNSGVLHPLVFSDYFYTEQEMRKEKLKRLNESYL